MKATQKELDRLYKLECELYYNGRKTSAALKKHREVVKKIHKIEGGIRC